MENALVVVDRKNALQTFTVDGEIDPILSGIRQKIDSFEARIDTPADRKEVASFAYKIAQSKSYLDGIGKELVDQYKEIPKKIDATRKRIRDTLDAWKDEVRGPLTEWETNESNRVKGHEAAIDAIIRAPSEQYHDASAIAARIESLRSSTFGDDCEEFLMKYVAARERAVAELQEQLAVRTRQEAEAAELARLRAVEAEREQAEREARIAKEAEDRATRAAEAAAQRERDAADKRELELKLQAAQAERRAADAEAKAKRDLEMKAAADAAEKARREANDKHRQSINKKVSAALMANGLSSNADCDLVTDLISSGKIPHVRIEY